jgi:aminoglycoside phosphotransferase (APT) family kinase protein
MHEGQVDIDRELVRRLIAQQFPRWSDLPIERFESTGTVNAIYRLGSDMYVRLPLVKGWAWHLKHEAKWLPRLRPHVPFEIPEVLGRGVPADGYPFDWSVYRWIDGDTWSPDRIADERQAALDLAAFLEALRAIDTGDRRPSGMASITLHDMDGWIRESIEKARDLIDADRVTAAWEAALELPAFDGPYSWVHADIGPDNLLIKDGRLSAVIDWGSVHVGDPVHDITAAWMFSPANRAVFRELLQVDDPTWARARAWCLRAVGAIDYYRESNPTMAKRSIAGLEAVLADLSSDG